MQKNYVDIARRRGVPPEQWEEVGEFLGITVDKRNSLSVAKYLTFYAQLEKLEAWFAENDGVASISDGGSTITNSSVSSNMMLQKEIHKEMRRLEAILGVESVENDATKRKTLAGRKWNFINVYLYGKSIR